jgi:hypothetical protein
LFLTIFSKGLDFEAKEGYLFRVQLLEGPVIKDTVTVNISLLNINDWDPQFKYPAYEFSVSEGELEKGSKIGEVQVIFKRDPR